MKLPKNKTENSHDRGQNPSGRNSGNEMVINDNTMVIFLVVTSKKLGTKKTAGSLVGTNKVIAMAIMPVTIMVRT